MQCTRTSAWMVTLCASLRCIVYCWLRCRALGHDGTQLVVAEKGDAIGRWGMFDDEGNPVDF